MSQQKRAINIRANSTVFMAGHAGVENESVTQPIQRYNTAFMFAAVFRRPIVSMQLILAPMQGLVDDDVRDLLTHRRV